MRGQPYPAYKASDVEWLGEVPEDWRIGRIKDSVALAKNGVWGEEPSDGADDVWCVRVADFDRLRLSVDGGSRTIRSVPPRDRIERVLSRGDLLLEKSGGGEKSPVGFVALYDFDDNAVCSNFVARMKLAEGMVPEYWTYLHATTYSVRLTQRSIKQTSGIQNLDQASYFNEFAAFPSVQEQRQIADYLDAQTAKIDTLIEKQERLIETLAERRQAVISHAVTKGLDPNAPMKDSGVDLIGLIPSHWSTLPLKRLVSKIEQGVSPQASAELADESSWGVVKSGCVNRGIFSEVQHKRLPDDFAFDHSIQIREGDLLVSRASGSPSLVGSAAIVRDLRYRLILSDKTFRLTVRPLHSAAFIERVMNSRLFRDQVLGAISGAGGLANNLPSSSLRQFHFPVPPIEEQMTISRYLDRETAKIDTLAAKAREMIDILRERRQALISAAVTGKIDVRGLA